MYIKKIPDPSPLIYALVYRGLGVETDYIHFKKKMSYIHFPSVKQPYFACTKPLHPISS